MHLMKLQRFLWGTLGASALLALTAAGSQAADELNEAIGIRSEANTQSRDSQAVVDVLSDKTDELLGEYKQILRQIEELRIYNSKMLELINSQNDEMASLSEQIDQAALVGRQVTPLMLKMIESLDRFVQLDVPFNLEERTQRVADLREMMDRANVSDAEKYRVIMEAYQIENEFGRTIEAYQGSLEVDGAMKTVDFLRFGRISLVYQTLDGQLAGYWDQPQRQWLTLGNEYRNPVREGLRIARKQKPPSLIKLPIAAPEVL